MNLILSKSSFEIIGLLIFNFFEWSDTISYKLKSLPNPKLVSVTISSRIPSSGGFVT